MNPTKYRPASPAAGDGAEPDEWADNALSNTLAWLSQVVTPRWCQTPDHWTAHTTNYLFTSCPCCLLWRGLILGGWSGFLMGLLIAGTLSWALL